MPHRLLFAFLPLLLARVANAEDNAAWNCQQTDSGEWSCVNQPLTESQRNALQAETSAAQSHKTAQPPVAKPVDTNNSDSAKRLKIPATIKEVAKTEAATKAPETAPLPLQSAKTPETAAKTPQPDTTRQEWTCQTTAGDDTRNCRLVGTPSKMPETATPAETEAGNWLLLNGAFDSAQETVFNQLKTRLNNDPWQNCGRGTVGNQRTVDPANRNVPLAVDADYSELFDNEIASFSGNVEIARADQHIAADKASYDAVSQTLDAQGQVFYNEEGLAIYSDTAALRLSEDQARLRDVQFIVSGGPIRGAAKNVYRDNKILSRYHDVAFTSCKPGNQDWVLRASRLKINKETGMGSAKNTWLEFKGVPILYTPYISFPTDGRRLSGFLSPTWGNTAKNGFDFALPFYWNIAPNYDATITPRYLSKRGEMLRVKARYLTEQSRGAFGVEYLPNDDITKTDRYSGSFDNTTIFTKHLNTDMDLNYVSDQDYLVDLNNALGFASTRFLRSRADLNYNREGVDFLARMESYQTVDRSIVPTNRPYQKLPEISLNFHHGFQEYPVQLGLNNNYTYFSRDGRENGQRFNFQPFVSVPLETASSFLIPKLSVLHSQYLITDQIASLPDNISRTLPIFSTDAGLLFDREMKIGGSAYVNTFEPRAYYLYIPNTDQSKIPLFDTSTYDQNYYSLFRENRFSGSDRIQDANQITLGFSTRLIDSANGLERAKFSLGNVLHFRDRDVTLRYQAVDVNLDAQRASDGNTVYCADSGVSDRVIGANRLKSTKLKSGDKLYCRDQKSLPGWEAETNTFSNLVGELSGQLTDRWSYVTGTQWNPHNSDFSRYQGAVRYKGKDNQLFNFGYRYRRDNPNYPSNIEQTDVSFRWPLFANWFAMGRWQYSLKFNETTESFVGLEKENCCWRFRILGRRFINTISESIETKPDTAFFVQLELKGLSSFGDSVDDFLVRNLNGYEKLRD